MTAPLAWPVEPGFPQELNIDFELSQNDNSITNDIEVGDPFKRRRDTVTYSTYRGWLYIPDLSLLQRLMDFWSRESASGTRPFLFQDPLTGVEKFFLLDGAPQIKPLGGGRFRANVVIREVPG